METLGGNRGLAVQTNELGRHGHGVRVAYWVGLSAGCLALAGCVTNDTVARRTIPHRIASAPANEHVVKKAAPAVRKHAGSAAAPHAPQQSVGYSAVGVASWYGADFHGRRTAAGETFDMNSLTAAHPTLPIPCTVRVTNLANHRSLMLRVNDRGPYVGNRVIDVSARSAQVLGFYDNGLAKVKVEYVGRAPTHSAPPPQDGE